MANALALCALHHKAFDLGAVGVSSERTVRVSPAFGGGARAEEFVARFNGAPLAEPCAPHEGSAEEHRAWHEREVFRAAAR